MTWFLSHYSINYPKTILYMLQGSEYRVKDYIAWLHRTKDFRAVMVRRKLDITQKIKLLVIFMMITSAITIFLGALGIFLGGWLAVLGYLLIIGLPWIISYIIIVPIWIGNVFIQRTATRRIVSRAHQKLSAHPGTKIAIAGSFGKTTAKEVLATILSEGKKVAATPGNMNTIIGTSRFIESLDGDEEIIIFEFGESQVGDISELCELVRPDMGLITGINEAHLESFGSIENTVATIFELREFLKDKPLFKNKESKLVADQTATDDKLLYSREGIDEWKVSDIKVSIHGTEFSIQKNDKVIWAKSRLIGEHTVGVLASSVAIADGFGLSASQITSGIKKVIPFEHRMQPRELHGAWVIDDTYNGNSEGVEAGLKLLKQLEAKRRVYVTPGLVEQGAKTQEVHEKIGRQIAVSTDVVVLMKNSVTDFISAGLQKEGFRGKLLIVDEPLEFYNSLDQFVAAGDVVLMQNDWTDNYA
jgi:UDP-N-acetylmuramoyl-tripeptide--D-alanyl-D-alanine ligase